MKKAMIEIKQDFLRKIIVVSYDDGSKVTYTDKSKFLSDHPDRLSESYVFDMLICPRFNGQLSG